MKHFSTVLVAFILVTSTNGDDPSTGSQQLDGLIATLRSLSSATDIQLEEIRYSLNNASTEAIQTMEAQLSAIRQTITSAISNATQAIENQAEEAIQSISKCIDEQREAANQLLNGIASGTIECFTSKIDMFTSYLTELSDISKEAASAASDATLSGNQCLQQSILLQPFCFTDLSIKFAAKNAILTTRAAFTITKISILLATLRESLSTCITLTFAKGGLNAAVVAGKIAYCSVTSS